MAAIRRDLQPFRTAIRPMHLVAPGLLKRVQAVRQPW
jgi:hypothetical protein